MKRTNAPTSVVVGIDGSHAAIQAAEWAIDEAISRDVPLRLVHVTHIPEAPNTPTDDFCLDIEYAETALRAAHRAVEATGKAVKVETAVVRGSPDEALIGESRDAEMICVGSVGIGRFARVLLGSTAAKLAQGAYCPVAIIRSQQDKPRSDTDWIAVVVNDSPDSDSAVEQAMEEAKLRGAPVLALGVWRWGLGEIPYDQLDRHLGKWVRQYPGIHVQPVAARSGAAEYLATTDESVQLVVIGAEDAENVSSLVGPHSHPVFGHSECSVLVVRR